MSDQSDVVITAGATEPPSAPVAAAPGTGDGAGAAPEAAAPGASSDEVAKAIAAVRDALVAAHPDAVPELITGATVEEIQASVTLARAVYQRVAEAVRAGLAAQGSPTGAPARSLPVNVEAMTPGDKIAAALRQRG